MTNFDDDIRRISVLVNDLGDGRDGDAWDRCRVVLEAAGRVDKEDAIDNLDGLVVCFYGMVVGEKAADIDISRYSNIRPSHGQTRALLSALPEVTK